MPGPVIADMVQTARHRRGLPAPRRPRDEDQPRAARQPFLHQRRGQPQGSHVLHLRADLPQHRAQPSHAAVQIHPKPRPVRRIPRRIPVLHRRRRHAAGRAQFLHVRRAHPLLVLVKSTMHLQPRRLPFGYENVRRRRLAGEGSEGFEELGHGEKNDGTAPVRQYDLPRLHKFPVRMLSRHPVTGVAVPAGRAAHKVSDPERTPEPSGTIIRLRTVVSHKDAAIAAITKKRAAQSSDIGRSSYPA